MKGRTIWSDLECLKAPFLLKLPGSLLAKVRTNQKAHEIYDTRNKKALRYAPWEGSFSFWYKNNLLFY